TGAASPSDPLTARSLHAPPAADFRRPDDLVGRRGGKGMANVKQTRCVIGTWLVLAALIAACGGQPQPTPTAPAPAPASPAPAAASPGVPASPAAPSPA